MEIACEGFVQTSLLTGEGEGIFDLQVVLHPGHTAVDSPEELLRKTRDFVLPAVIKAWTQQPEKSTELAAEPKQRDIVYKGTFDEVNRHFYNKGWSAGLPIVPPTLKRVDEFMKYTDLPADKSFGPMAPGFREATVWSVAVNGVMAGCRPEYMPVLTAIVEAFADSKFFVAHRGSTVSWEPMVILNGPVMDQLGFNYGVGMFRAGTLANTSVQHFMKLYMRNIPGFRAGLSDKSAFGRNTFELVFVEDEFHSPWAPINTSLGAKAGANTVIALGHQSMSKHYQPEASDPTEMLDKLAVILKIGLLDRGHMSLGFQSVIHDVLVISPIIANVIAKKYTREEAQQYLYKKARVSVRQWEERIFAERAAKATILAKYMPDDVDKVLSDPDGMVPMYHTADELLIVVGGDYMRNRCFVAGGVGHMGFATLKEVKLPKNWGEVPKVLR